MAKSLEKGSSLHPPPPHRRGDHLPRLAEAAAGPKDVIFVFVASPVLVGGGSAASAVLCEGGGGINVTSKEKKGGPKDIVALFPRIRLRCFFTLLSEDPCNSSGNHLFIAFPVHCDSEGKKVIQAFIGQHKCDALLWRHLTVSILRTHLLPGILNPGRGQVAADGGRLINGVLYFTSSKESQPDSNRRKPLADTFSSVSTLDPLR